MKKIYLLAFSALLAGSSIAQTAKRKPTKAVLPGHTSVSTAKIKKNSSVNNAQAIWSDTFADAATWEITDSLMSVPTQEWVIGQGTAWGGGATMISTTAADGYAMFDSDGYGNGTTNNCTMVNAASNVIDLTGHNNVYLKFEEHYIQYFDSVTVYVSGDGGTTWTAFDPHPQIGAEEEIGGSDAGGTDAAAVVTTIDISAVAGGMANVKVAFNYKGAWDYWWFIDDVRIEDIPSVNMTSLSNVLLTSLNASSCDLAADNLAVIAKNDGLTPITVGTANDTLVYTVNGVATTVAIGDMVGSVVVDLTGTPVTTINPQDTVAIIILAAIDLTADGDYVITSSIHFDGSGDGISTDNTSNTINISNYASAMLDNGDIYFEDFDLGGTKWTEEDADGNGAAWYNDTQALFSYNNSPGVLLYYAGSTPAVADDWAISSCMEVTAGSIYYLKYYSSGFTGYNPAVLTPYVLSDLAAPASGNILITLPAATAAATAMDVYGMDSTTFTATQDGRIYIGFNLVSDGSSAEAHALGLENVEVGLVSPVGLKNNVTTDVVSIFPNPNAGVFTVKATENNSSVSVYSIIGANVYSSKLVKGNNSIDLSNLAAGSYVVKVNNGGSLVTKRVVINK